VLASPHWRYRLARGSASPATSVPLGRGIDEPVQLAGLSNRDIAEKLTISRKTAGSHIEHIYTKTGVRNRAGASLFAMRHGLMIE
jgi:hypothetical protein